MWTEADEIAETIMDGLSPEQIAEFARSSNAARHYLRSIMPDQGEVALSNTVESLHFFCKAHIMRPKQA